MAVDADGEVLQSAARSGPTIVTPNRREAEELVGYEFSGDADDELIEALAAVRRLGPQEALITLPDGCAAALREGNGIVVRRARIPQREALAPIGSGDAFLAGFLAARYQGRTDADALRYAVACGADSTQRLGAGVVDPDEVSRLSDMVELAARARSRRLLAVARQRPGVRGQRRRRCFSPACCDWGVSGE